MKRLTRTEKGVTRGDHTPRGRRIFSRSVALAAIGTKGPGACSWSSSQPVRSLSLFEFTRDSAGKSTCNRKCSKTWYPLIANGNIVIRSRGIYKKQLTTFKRRDGSRQIEYWGHPLPLLPEHEDRAGGRRGHWTGQLRIRRHVGLV